MSHFIKQKEQVLEREHRSTSNQTATVDTGYGPIRVVEGEYSVGTDSNGNTVVTITAEIINRYERLANEERVVMSEDHTAYVMVENDKYEDSFANGQLSFEVQTGTNFTAEVGLTSDAMHEAAEFEVDIQ
jgi:hypothetical protein